MNNSFGDYLLAFADDEHLMGQRHTEWIGVAPFLEEDMAFSSIGQDELGHAAALYGVVLGLGSDLAISDHDIDDLALMRDGSGYRSCALVELPCADWADALVRHFMYDAAEQSRWECLRGSPVTILDEFAVQAERDEKFHRRHAQALVDALMVDPAARARLAEAAQRLAPLAFQMFGPSDAEAEALASGAIAAAWVDSRPAWQAHMVDTFGTLEWPGTEGDRTVRTEHFESVYASMREVILLDPTARW